MRFRLLSKPYLAAFVLAVCFVPLARPAYAGCMGFMLGQYLESPQRVIGPGAPLVGCRMVLGQIVAVHPDAQPESNRWSETGTVELSTVQSTDASQPKTFNVRYEKRRSQLYECATWDQIEVKPGARLVLFVRPDKSAASEWSVPELSASGVVARVDWMKPAFLSQVQQAFHSTAPPH